MADTTSSNGGNGSGGAGGVLRSLLSELPVDRLKDELQHGMSSLGEKALESAGERISGLSDRLTGVAENGGVIGKAAQEGMEEAVEGGSPVKGALKGGLSGAKDKVKEKLTGGGSGGEKGTRCTNIIEEIDVGVPLSVAYNQWTQFQDFPSFTKKVESVEQEEEVKVSWKAQVFWSHRRWESTIIEQVPDERIVWRSKGDKGYVDGAVSFHELAPNLTRILVVLEYYPQGLFERTGNLWRAQGRRARLELKHFRRHVMTQTILEPDEVEGWRGEIRDGEVARSHEEVVEEEQARDEEGEDYAEGDQGDEEYAEGDQGDEEYADGAEPAEDEYAEEEPEQDDSGYEESEESEEPEPAEDEGEYAEEEAEYEEPAEEGEYEEEPAEEGEYEEPAEEDEYEEPAEEDQEPEERPARSRRRARR
jgi:uncharacterized membrane protein